MNTKHRSAKWQGRFLFLSSLTLVTLAQGRELHEGLTHQRDWSKVSHQFNLRKHLMAPTTRDLRDGIENSRRLARNAIKLGIDDETHRKVSNVLSTPLHLFNFLQPYYSFSSHQLVADNPPSGIITYFDAVSTIPDSLFCNDLSFIRHAF